MKTNFTHADKKELELEPLSDIDRLRNEYADRQSRLSESKIYSLFNLATLFVVQQRERAVMKALKHQNIEEINNKQILEIGCGGGGVLSEFLRYGANSHQLVGIDLLFNRLGDAHKRLSLSSLVNADGQALPFSSGSFDLVMQFTAFSSLLDDGVKENIAKDMLRVLKPNGLILWYDFWLNPFNKQTKGIRPNEIRTLFSNCSFRFYKITLAPPIARRIIPISWGMALFLESLKVFNSHWLVTIRPQTS